MSSNRGNWVALIEMGQYCTAYWCSAQCLCYVNVMVRVVLRGIALRAKGKCRPIIMYNLTAQLLHSSRAPLSTTSISSTHS